MNSRRHRCSLAFVCMAGAGAWDHHPMLTGSGLCVILRPCVVESVSSVIGILA